jgi:glycosyltransferase involved in cell wall biosynthesis
LNNLKLSIIIPAYNEENRISATLDALVHFLSTHSNLNLKNTEIIIANDGSSDNTLEKLQNYNNSTLNLKIISYAPNKGKGFAIRKLIEKSSAPLIVCNDADMAIDWKEVESFMSCFESTPELDILIGSKGMNESHSNISKWHIRRIMGRAFNFLVRIMTGLNFSDTQCGFKMFRRNAALSLVSLLTIDRFAWDVEFLMKAQSAQFNIKEKAVSWRLDKNSRVRVIRDSLEMIKSIIKIKLGFYKTKHD